ncbi:MAG: DUF805 domain-containing protein [Alloacidobacterium sp.]|jgi:uncharacterized membrane protein YhaH (DUF805 family)
MRWYFQVLKNYAKFEGRARRAEYWSFVFLNLVIGCAVAFVAAAFGVAGSSILSGPGDHVMQAGTIAATLASILYGFFVLIPSIAVAVRRMHDTGRSGWWLWAPVISFIFLCLGSERRENGYGANPLAAELPRSAVQGA